MAITFIPFDGWSPGGGYIGEGWDSATNLYPHFGAWRPWRKFLSLPGTVLDGPMTGCHVHRWAAPVASASYNADAQTVFCGSIEHLYSVSTASGAFTDLTRAAGGNYGAGFGPGGWRFATVGNDIWAADWVDEIQRRTNNAGSFANGCVSTFKPKARFIATVREHLMVANLSNAGRFQDEVAWSDADDGTNFDPATLTGTSIASAKRLTEIPGQITGLIGQRQGAMVFKRSAVYYLYYTGTTQVFQPDLLSSSVGTGFPSSIINSRYGVFFMGSDGFYKIDGISAPTKISPPGLDASLLDSPLTNLTGSVAAYVEDLQFRGFQSSTLPLIGWLFNFTVSEAANRMAILYNPIAQQWSLVDVASDEGTGDLLPSVIVERPFANNIYNTLAAITYSGGTSRYAPLSSSGTSTYGATLKLRFRPANIDSAGKQGQSILAGVLPVLTKTDVAGAALTPTVTAEPMLDPFLAPYGATETMPAAFRDVIAGWYPIQRAGRFFRVSILTTVGEDFTDFPGLWVDQDLLS